MDRRRFAILLAAISMPAGCKTAEEPAATAALLSNKAVKDAFNAMDSAIEDLEKNVERFDSGQDWKLVVPKVKSSAGDVRDAFDRFRFELGIPNY